MNTIEINVTSLKAEEKFEFANAFIKLGYRVAIRKEKVGSRNRQVLVADKEEPA